MMRKPAGPFPGLALEGKHPGKGHVHRSMASTHATPDHPAPTPRRWDLADIDFSAVDRQALEGDALARPIVFLASLIETGSDVYAGNLAAYFSEDPELAGWLAQAWEPEELQHGRALRAYVEHVWPEIDWQRAYDAFFEEYSSTCTMDLLEPTRTLELAARCMVETGTAALYGALHRHAREPVLKDLAARIYADEVRHYKHFYRHFRRYQSREGHSRWRIARTLFKRLRETRTGDGYHAFHGMGALGGGASGSVESEYREFARAFGEFVSANAPRETTVRMGLRPLGLPAPVEEWAIRHSAPIYAWWTR